MQNIHRYFLYIAVFIIGILGYDAWKALWFTDAATGHVSFGIGLGTLVLTANVVLLSGYTSAATPCVTWRADSWTGCLSRPSARRPTTVPVA